MSVTAELLVGAQAKLAPTPYDTSNRPLSGRAFAYSSSAPGIAKVDANGVVTAVAIGVATITATAEGKSASTTVRVVPQIATVVASRVIITPGTAASLPAGQTLQLTAAPVDANGNPLSNAGLVWSSANPAIATVNAATGLVTGVAIGTTVITAAVAGLQATLTVAVTQAQDGSLTDLRSVVQDNAMYGYFEPGGAQTTFAGAKATQVTDARGAGFPFVLTGVGTAGPVASGDGGLAITQDSDQYMQIAANALLDMAQPDFWIAALIAVTSGSGNPAISWDDGSTNFGASGQAIGWRDDGTVYDVVGFRNPYGQVASTALSTLNRTASVASRTTYRLVFLEKHKALTGTQQSVFTGFAGLEVYGAQRMVRFNAGSTNGLGGVGGNDFITGNAVVNWGRESGLNTVASKLKMLAFGTGELPLSWRQAFARRAVALGGLTHHTANAVAAVPDIPVIFSHDSNGQGYGTTNTDTKAHPYLLQLALNAAYPGRYIVKQNGWAGTTAIDHALWHSRLVAPEINLQTMTRVVHVCGPLITNDITAIIPPNAREAVIDALRSMCQDSRALGAKTLLPTMVRASSNDELTTPAIAAIDAFVRGAKVSGISDEIYDPYTTIGVAAEGVHMDDAQNQQYATEEQPLIVSLAPAA